MYCDDNIILLTDSYKTSHWRQYPPKTQSVYSYFESRAETSELMFFGLQMILKRYFEGKVISKSYIDEAETYIDLHMGKGIFNRKGWEALLERHKGELPISIYAMAEGAKYPSHMPLIAMENTDDEFPWLTNYLESLLVQVWYPISVASLSYKIRKLILEFLESTGSPATVGFKLHDFGFRGVSSVESAGIGGLAHLVNFDGSDTMCALRMAKEYYNCMMAGFSIPASEHSTITSWGKESELEAYANMLEQYPSGLVACVSDSYNIFHACSELWGTQLKDKVLKRDGVLVIRPDSGNPCQVIMRVLDILATKFGSALNEKGYKVLHPKVRVLQGDGVNFLAIEEILTAMKQGGYSADNIAFGMGGALLQKLNRDTHKFAFKCSQVLRDNHVQDVYKDPITDKGKQSKKGRFNMIPGMREVFRDGALVLNDNFDAIRKRARA